MVERGGLRLVAHRLAIVPPLDERPVFQDPTRLLVLNGEVYGLPAAPDGRCTDTARLAAVLACSGASALVELKGLFAICQLDEDGLLLARDRFGIKPLYYASLGGGLVFASEIKALLALPGMSREPDPDVLAAFAVFGHNVFTGQTPFRHVRALRPGHCLRARTGLDARETPFVSQSRPPVPGQGEIFSAEQAAQEAERLLDEAVRRAMRHDPGAKAVFLSGGIDSALLLELAREHGNVAAWVLADHDEADDLLEARKVASALGVSLREVRLSPQELDRELVLHSWQAEQPVAAGAFDLLGGVAFQALCRAVSREHRVALCGEGADEIFLGYHRLHVDPGPTLHQLRERAIRLGTPALRDWLAGRGLDGDGQYALRGLRETALCEGLSEYHLPCVDRAGMAFGLEVRPPYLDEDLVSYCSGLDESVLLDRSSCWTKVPLRHIARRRLTAPGLERVAVRRKRAMPAAAEQAGARLAQSLARVLPERPGLSAFQPALLALFRYLHVDPGFESPPDFTFTEFATEILPRMIRP